MRALSPLVCAVSFGHALLAQLPVVPAPQHAEDGQDRIAVTSYECKHEPFARQFEALTTTLSRLGAPTALAHGSGATMRIRPFADGEAHPAESYRILLRGGAAEVWAADAAGLARAAATLCQLLEIEQGVAVWPSVTIDDAPGLPFRCFMVDLGRNPHSPEILRQVVDLCWFYKVRFLQLHLTDDQLCSWPSRVFPKLVDQRAGWTMADWVALEAHAVARGVALIPEIDMPGHSSILRDRYPEVFGKTPEELATTDAAAEGAMQLIDELLEVFRSTPYVHLGGDESGVGGDPLRDFLNRMARHVESRARRAIVWEGPSLGEGEHKLDTRVLQMNWDTIHFPAQQMLDAGYEVVNAAWDPMYIVDHYPRTMFTAVPLRRCYDWDLRRFAHVDPGMPTFAQPHVTNTAEGIVGFCMPWWEGREQNLLGLCAPRLAAVAAAAWNRDGERDLASFVHRQQRLLQRFEVIAGATLPDGPHPTPLQATSGTNVALGRPVHVSHGEHQPPFGPERLTNGVTARADHFLGYPCRPRPLEITVDLGAPIALRSIVVHENAVDDSHEVYEVLLSADGVAWQQVGATTTREARGEKTFAAWMFPRHSARFVRIRTEGCHDLTFPSFSRLCEIEAIAD